MPLFPSHDQITITQVSITSNAERGLFIHNEYRWKDGLFESPLHSELVEFNNGTQYPLLSQYVELTGSQGAGVIPDDGAEVTIISNKIDFDDFEFDYNTNNFRYLRTATYYGKTTTDLAALLAASTTATPINTRFAPQFSAQFTMPAGTATEKFLYLIWDYRKSTRIQACYSSVSSTDACCTCAVEPTPTATLTPTPTPYQCYKYELEMPGTCAAYAIIPVFNTTSAVSYTDCQGTVVNVSVDDPEILNVYAQTGTVTASNGATIQLLTANVGGSVGTFF